MCDRLDFGKHHTGYAFTAMAGGDDNVVDIQDRCAREGRKCFKSVDKTDWRIVGKDKDSMVISASVKCFWKSRFDVFTES